MASGAAAADLARDAEAASDQQALLRPGAPARRSRLAWRLAAVGAVAAVLVLGAAAAAAAAPAAGRGPPGCAGGSCRAAPSRGLDATLQLKLRRADVSKPAAPASVGDGGDDGTRVLVGGEPASGDDDTRNLVSKEPSSDELLSEAHRWAFRHFDVSAEDFDRKRRALAQRIKQVWSESEETTTSIAGEETTSGDPERRFEGDQW